MKNKTFFACMVILLLALGLFARPVTAQYGGSMPAAHDSHLVQRQADLVPAGLTAVEWETLQTELLGAEYHLTDYFSTDLSPPQYNAFNRAQGWDAAFTADGIQVTPHSAAVSWQFGLRLTGYGYAGNLKSFQDLSGVVPTLTSDKATLTYAWDENISEWWLNAPAGLEQGFTLQERPIGGEQTPLVLELDIRGNLTPVLEGNKVLFQDEHGKTILHYDKLYITDANNQVVPAYFRLSSSNLSLQIVIDDAQAVFPLFIDPWVQQAKLTASDAAGNDYFGYAVAVDGDTAVIGAYQDDDAGTSSGSAYIFVRSGTTWTQQQKLTASDAAGSDYFGSTVAISGDTVVVGAYGEDDLFGGSGAAYVFVRSGTTWTEQQRLKASDAAGFDYFGFSVAVDGDTAVIGAYQDDDAGTSSGSAYVFVRSGTTWTQQQKLTASDAAANDYFGISIAVEGDTAVVGSYYDDDNGYNSGSAYVFVRNGAAWSEQQKLLASDGAAGDNFGNSVAVSGNTVVVGAPQNNGSGSAYFYIWNGATWTQQQKVKASDAAAGALFGKSVAINGDMSVIGAYGDNTSSGAAYVFVRSGLAWSQQQKLLSTDLAGGDALGYAVGVSNGAVVAGAYRDDFGAGSAYVFTPCIATAQSGNWSDGATWVGGVVPAGTDGTCIQNGHTVTLDAAGAVDTLWVFTGATLDLATNAFTVDNGVWNYGTLRQTKTVDGTSAVNFLQIRDSGDTTDQYRGVDIAAGVDLGSTVVEVKGNTTVCNTNDGGAYRNRCYMVNPANPGVVDITLYSTSGEDDLTNDAFFQNTSISTWTQGASCADGSGSGGACTGSATFASPVWFLIGDATNAPTVVSLQNFAAQQATQNLGLLLAAVLLGVLALGVGVRVAHKKQ